jgi:YjbE family integral membrane protein
VEFTGLPADLTVLAQVVMIDVALAGDNAVVVGMAVAGLPLERRRMAILLGLGGATLLRILLGAVALRLLAIIGLTLAGGLLLLWVCWRMFSELRMARRAHGDVGARKTLRQAMTQIIAADLSMSLDNVLAVAGAAHGHPWVLVCGLCFSVVLMAAAATAIARMLDRFRWIGWVGLVIVLHVALSMIWEGWHDVSGRLAT